MRRPRSTRVKKKSRYLITSKVAGGQFLFDSETLDFFRDLLLKVAYFSGVKILSYTFLNNHFHLLILVYPKATKVSDKKVLKRVRRLYGKEYADTLQRKVQAALETGDKETVKALLAPYRARMNDLSEFLKTLKQRMTIYVNTKLEREGTLWQGRFHSVLVEDDEPLLRIVSSYIDLNPVRAKIVSAPEAYRWSSIGEACSTGRREIVGLRMIGSLYPTLPSKVARSRYLALLKSKLSPALEDDPRLDVSVRNPYLVKSRIVGRPLFVSDVAGNKPAGGTTLLHGKKCDYVSVGRVSKQR